MPKEIKSESHMEKHLDHKIIIVTGFILGLIVGIFTIYLAMNSWDDIFDGVKYYKSHNSEQEESDTEKEKEYTESSMFFMPYHTAIKDVTMSFTNIDEYNEKIFKAEDTILSGVSEEEFLQSNDKVIDTKYYLESKNSYYLFNSPGGIVKISAVTDLEDLYKTKAVNTSDSVLSHNCSEKPYSKNKALVEYKCRTTYKENAETAYVRAICIDKVKSDFYMVYEDILAPISEEINTCDWLYSLGYQDIKE